MRHYWSLEGHPSGWFTLRKDNGIFLKSDDTTLLEWAIMEEEGFDPYSHEIVYNQNELAATEKSAEFTLYPIAIKEAKNVVL